MLKIPFRLKFLGLLIAIASGSQAEPPKHVKDDSRQRKLIRASTTLESHFLNIVLSSVTSLPGICWQGQYTSVFLAEQSINIRRILKDFAEDAHPRESCGRPGRR